MISNSTGLMAMMVSFSCALVIPSGPLLWFFFIFLMIFSTCEIDTSWKLNLFFDGDSLDSSLISQLELQQMNFVCKVVINFTSSFCFSSFIGYEMGQVIRLSLSKDLVGYLIGLHPFIKFLLGPPGSIPLDQLGHPISEPLVYLDSHFPFIWGWFHEFVPGCISLLPHFQGFRR